MGIRPIRKFIDFNSSKVESTTGNDFLEDINDQRFSLVCTELTNITSPNDVWITAFVEWIGLFDAAGQTVTSQFQARFEIWRDFGTAEQESVCSTSDTNSTVGETPGRATTTLTCVDKDVPSGNHTYCLVILIPDEPGVSVRLGIRAFNREITVAEIKI